MILLILDTDCSIPPEAELPAKCAGLLPNPLLCIWSVPTQAEHTWPFIMISNPEK